MMRLGSGRNGTPLWKIQHFAGLSGSGDLLTAISVQEFATHCRLAPDAAPDGQFSRMDFFDEVLICSQCWVKMTEHSRRQVSNDWGKNMQWTAPAFEEVCLNCEINSYVSAKL
jgi:coenzyme PQQ precursor peptide PqqA